MNGELAGRNSCPPIASLRRTDTWRDKREALPFANWTDEHPLLREVENRLKGIDGCMDQTPGHGAVSRSHRQPERLETVEVGVSQGGGWCAALPVSVQFMVIQ
jgi:hypothetical protein